MSNPELFKQNKYTVVKKALSEDAARLVGNSLIISEARDEMVPDDMQVVGASCSYGLTIMESVLLQLHKTVEENTGLRLCPTYSFTRIYRAGDVLARHTDRPSCEISATLTLNYKADKLWPIGVKNLEGRDIDVSLDIGDLMIYRGCEVEHWRDAFEGDLWMQVFIHYIDMNGPFYPECAFDKRGDYIPPVYRFIMDHL
jgi:hypothetical protein